MKPITAKVREFSGLDNHPNQLRCPFKCRSFEPAMESRSNCLPSGWLMTPTERGSASLLRSISVGGTPHGGSPSFRHAVLVPNLRASRRPDSPESFKPIDRTEVRSISPPPASGAVHRCKGSKASPSTENEVAHRHGGRCLGRAFSHVGVARTLDPYQRRVESAPHPHQPQRFSSKQIARNNCPAGA